MVGNAKVQTCQALVTDERVTINVRRSSSTVGYEYRSCPLCNIKSSRQPSVLFEVSPVSECGTGKLPAKQLMKRFSLSDDLIR